MTMVQVAPSPAAISSQASASAVLSMPAPPCSSGIVTPHRPIAAEAGDLLARKVPSRGPSARAFGARRSRA